MTFGSCSQGRVTQYQDLTAWENGIGSGTTSKRSHDIGVKSTNRSVDDAEKVNARIRNGTVLAIATTRRAELPRKLLSPHRRAVKQLQ